MSESDLLEIAASEIQPMSHGGFPPAPLGLETVYGAAAAISEEPVNMMGGGIPLVESRLPGQAMGNHGGLMPPGPLGV